MRFNANNKNTKRSSFDGIEWAKSRGLEVDTWNMQLNYTKRHVHNNIVLDAGCGGGSNTNILSHYAKEIHGMDLLDENIKLSNNKYKSDNLHFKKGNVEKIPYPDSFFDVVYSCWVVEHLENPQFFFEEAHRVLKKEGILILWVPNVKSFMGVITKILSNENKVRVLSLLSKKTEDDVSHQICHYKANSVSSLDYLMKYNFERIFMKRLDTPHYYRQYFFLTYLWYLKHQITKNNILNFSWPSLYVEYKKI